MKIVQAHGHGLSAPQKRPKKPDAQVRTERIAIGDEVRFTYLARPAELYGQIGEVVGPGPMATKRIRLPDGRILLFLPHEIERTRA